MAGIGERKSPLKTEGFAGQIFGNSVGLARHFALIKCKRTESDYHYGHSQPDTHSYSSVNIKKTSRATIAGITPHQLPSKAATAKLATEMFKQ